MAGCAFADGAGVALQVFCGYIVIRMPAVAGPYSVGAAMAGLAPIILDRTLLIRELFSVAPRTGYFRLRMKRIEVGRSRPGCESCLQPG